MIDIRTFPSIQPNWRLQEILDKIAARKDLTYTDVEVLVCSMTGRMSSLCQCQMITSFSWLELKTEKFDVVIGPNNVELGSLGAGTLDYEMRWKIIGTPRLYLDGALNARSVPDGLFEKLCSLPYLAATNLAYYDHQPIQLDWALTSTVNSQDWRWKMYLKSILELIMYHQ